MKDNDHLFVAYWRAVDAGDAEQIRASTEQILDDLAHHLAALANKAAQQLRSPLAEFDDLMSIMHIKVLQVLRGMPRTVTTPGGYLVQAAHNGLCDHLRRVIPTTHHLSLDEPRRGRYGDDYTLLDLLPAAVAPVVTDATLSRSLADVLSMLKPSEQVAIQDEYHFDNWTPRTGQRPTPPRLENLYHAHTRLRALCQG